MPILILSNSYKEICSYELFGSVVNTHPDWTICYNLSLVRAQ